MSHSAMLIKKLWSSASAKYANHIFCSAQVTAGIFPAGEGCMVHPQDQFLRILCGGPLR